MSFNVWRTRWDLFYTKIYIDKSFKPCFAFDWPLLIVTDLSVTHHAFLVKAGVDLKSLIPREMSSLIYIILCRNNSLPFFSLIIQREKSCYWHVLVKFSFHCTWWLSKTSEYILLLIEFEVRTVNYGPSFSPSIYCLSAKRMGHKSSGGKNKDPQLKVRTKKTRLVRYLLYLYCVSDGFGNDFHSWGMAPNFWTRSKAKRVNLNSFFKSIACFITQFRVKVSFKLLFASYVEKIWW